MEQAIGGEAKNIMKKRKIDYNMPIGDIKKVDDFLPSPEKLVVSENAVKITLRLNKASVNFFKKQAKKYHTKYQKMIRLLLDKYAEKYSS